MKNKMKEAAVCVTISALFVLVVFCQRAMGLLGPGATGVALFAAAALPAEPEIGASNGPVWPPDPVDIPGARAKVMNGPVWPPDPVDIPGAEVMNGPVWPPDPVDIPTRSAS